MGGKAFKEEPTRRILKEEIQPTLVWLSENLFFSLEYLTSNLLGSAGKNASSGDLDIAVGPTTDLKFLTGCLESLLGKDFVQSRPGNNQIFSSVPICGNAENGRVQIDWMFGEIEWLHFSYHSPSEKESKYKGLFRTELIKAIITSCSQDYQYENEQLVGRVGPTFFHDRGVEWRCRYRPMRKDGKARRQDFIITTLEEYEEIFNVQLAPLPTRITDPNEVVHLITGTYLNCSRFNSYESVWQVCCEYRLDLNLIGKLFIERLNNLKVEIPEEIMRQVKGIS